MSANKRQEGGKHYQRLSPQPWDVIAAWDLGFFEGNVVKYLARWRHKDGLQDLLKAKHYLDKLIEQQRKQQRRVLDEPVLETKFDAETEARR